MKNYDYANYFLVEMEAYIKEQSFRDYAMLYELKARWHYMHDDLDSSLYYMHSLLRLDEQQTNTSENNKLLGDYVNLVNVSSKLDDPKSFSHYAVKAIAMAKHFDNWSYVSSVAGKGVDFYTRVGTLDSVAYYSQLLQEVNDKIRTKSQASDLKLADNAEFLERINDNYRSTEQVLNETEEELESKEESLSFLRWILWGAMFIVLVLITQRFRQQRIIKALTLKNLELVERNEVPIVVSKPEVAAVKVPEEKKRAILTGLKTLFAETENYKSEEFKLNNLAAMLDTNSNYLTAVINETFNSNFADYVNSHRVSLAMKYLLDQQFDQLTIEGIGSEVGFRSKSSFFAVFKKHTGLTPSQFKKQASIEQKP